MRALNVSFQRFLCNSLCVWRHWEESCWYSVPDVRETCPSASPPASSQHFPRNAERRWRSNQSVADAWRFQPGGPAGACRPAHPCSQLSGYCRRRCRLRQRAVDGARWRRGPQRAAPSGPPRRRDGPRRRRRRDDAAKYGGKSSRSVRYFTCRISKNSLV